MSLLFERNTLGQVECHMCTIHMYTSIRLCVKGHIFCSECFDGLRRCPVCKGPKRMACDYVMERIFMKLTIPCKYAVNGCRFTGIGMVLKEHEGSCEFSSSSASRYTKIGKSSSIPRRIR